MDLKTLTTGNDAEGIVVEEGYLMTYRYDQGGGAIGTMWVRMRSTRQMAC